MSKLQLTGLIIAATVVSLCLFYGLFVLSVVLAPRILNFAQTNLAEFLLGSVAVLMVSLLMARMHRRDRK